MILTFKNFLWKAFVVFRLRCESRKWEYNDIYFDSLKWLLCNGFAIC